MNRLTRFRGLAQVEALVAGVIAEGLGGGSKPSAVEVVGGGSRIPFIVSAIQAGSGLASVGRTLDSANALCIGEFSQRDCLRKFPIR